MLFSLQRVKGVYMNSRTLKKNITELGGVQEAAGRIGVSRQCVYLWLKRGVSRYGVLLLEQALREKRGNKKHA